MALLLSVLRDEPASDDASIARRACGRLAVALQPDCRIGAVSIPREPAMAALRVYVCGQLALERGSLVRHEGDFPARQGRRLWAALVLLRRGPVGRDELAEAVWGDEAPDAWDAALNALVSRLRALLRPFAAGDETPTIRGEVGRYRLVLPPDAFVDLERARAALHAAETALRRDRLMEALTEARVAMEIAARGFLPGEEAPWIEGQRRALADLRLHAVETTVAAELRRGNPDLAEREAEHLIALDPLHETGYRLRMQALAASGNPALARRVMDDLRRILREQAGAEPSPETERLFQEVVGPR
jgi:DNA-binding SARP family transcriptional activator